jgi:hypothetical protein
MKEPEVFFYGKEKGSKDYPLELKLRPWTARLPQSA